MSKILLIGGYMLIILWAIGFFLFHMSGWVHILPVIALIGFVFRLLYNKSVIN
jgi:hypothetical protein